DELGDHAELQQVLGHHVAEDVGRVGLFLGPDDGVEADALLADPRFDDLFEAGERAAADEQHVRGVDLDELLVRVLAAALRGHRGRGAFEDLEECLLDAFTGDVAGYRRVLALAGDLVDLVDVDDAGLGRLDVVVGGLDELEQDVLDILADVAGLGEGRGVGDGDGHVEHLRQGLRQERLARARGAQQQDVALGQLKAVVSAPVAGLHPLVVVVDRHRERLLRLVLTDDVGVEELVDLPRLGQVVPLELGGLGELLLDDLVAEIDALIADVDAWTGNELLDLLLALSTERALQQVSPVADACHPRYSFAWDRPALRDPCPPDPVRTAQVSTLPSSGPSVSPLA